MKITISHLKIYGISIIQANLLETENPFSDITPEDEEFIKSIITGVLELNEKLDANTTAKIKTLILFVANTQGCQFLIKSIH